MEPDRRTLNERLRDASVEETLRGGKWLLTATLRQRIVRLLVMQVGVSALLVGFFLLLARSDLGAAIFSIAVTEGIMLVMGLAAAHAQPVDHWHQSRRSVRSGFEAPVLWNS
jgi:hypothetical protein